MLKKFIPVMILCMALAPLAGCGENLNGGNDSSMYKVGYQLEKPSVGDEIAIISTSAGEFRVRFFPEAAPKAVENFKTLSRDGYYNGTTFHRVIQDFMIQGGDPQGNGTGGQSTWGEDFEDEFSNRLFNITGAMAMANKGKNTNGSQFFINYQDPSSFGGWVQYEKAYEAYGKDPSKFSNTSGSIIDMSKVNDDVKKLYEEHGGNPTLDGYSNVNGRGHTVFGQVYQGLEIIEQISKVETDSNDQPVQKVEIKGISIEPYKE